MSDSGSFEETIFIRARQLSRPEERAAFLEQACGHDRALRERVERMLSAEQKADQFLANNPLHVDTTILVTLDGREAVGSMIGRYKLLQQIGEGGCGVVYMAEQEQPIHRRVALKVIKPGMDTRQVIARFEAERQAVSMMDHPNIARVLDAGATEAGRPYFAMELVRGIRITDYCDQNNLATRERLDLFTKVVQAVQHAHQKGIIHRDIKPSNVLITLHDGVPVPKVIDFGIAKALEQKLTDKTLFTQFEQFIGTPAYTSPEQAEMSGLDIDTRSDIYSLGVLLYELLVGKTPFDAQELMQSGLDEMRRMIRQQEPERPSTRLSTMLQGEVTTTAQRRRVSVPELVHLLKGDLDWIVMKCLEKDRTRRYDTANGLGRDIERYLGNEPVTARPPSRSYRFGKLVRRNKLAFAASTAVVTALLIGIVVSTWQAVRAHRAEQAAKEEKDSAEAVLQFFRDNVMAAGRPEGQDGGLGKDVTLRQAIDAAEREISKTFTNRPLVEASIRKTLGESYRYLGEPALAVQQLERALALRRQVLGLEHPETLECMSILVRAYSYMEAGTVDQAVPLAEETLRLMKARWGPEHPDTLSIMANLAKTYENVGKYDQALALFEETLKLQKAVLGPDHADTIKSMDGLAWTYSWVGQHDQALSLFEETFKLSEAKLGPDHPGTLRFMSGLGWAYGRWGKADEGLSLLEKALKGQRAKLGPHHPETLQSMYFLAIGYDRAGSDKAIPLYEETFKMLKEKLGLDHPLTREPVANLADAYVKAGKFDQAVALAQEIFNFTKAELGPEHPDTLVTMADLAWVYHRTEKFDQALALYEEKFKLQKAKLGPEHLETLDAMYDLAAGYWAAGKLDQSVQVQEQLLKLRKTVLGLDHRDTFESLRYLAADYLEMGKADEAEELLGQAILEMREVNSTNASVLVVRADSRARRGQWSEAAADLAEAIQMQPTDHHLYHTRAACLVQTGDVEAYRRHCSQIMSRFSQATDPHVAERMAKDCSILPASGVDLAALERMTDSALAAGETQPYFRWFLYAKGLVQYRQGRYADAGETMQKVQVKSVDRPVPVLDVQRWMVLAMARHQLQEK